ncbi:hypothetical protein BOX15_Mlig030837g1 [Macrostomum lignano]|uniref:Uncharacterized protein n=2 Tax=Macrostomum lignano TaxID=282301 RepID=A0A267FHA4_9PLAT|nr:hypothetical protein BOX15_Mlig030837g1 [Macrostomum lignano]
MFVAAQRGYSRVVRCLAASVIGASIDCRTAASGATPLHTAALRRQLGAVRQLLHAGADANLRRGDTGETVLHLAARVGDVRIARLLVGGTGGADPTARDFRGDAAWQAAQRRGHVTLASELREVTGEIDALAATDPERPLLSDSDLSVSLHRNLLAAGFHQLTACLHAATVDATEAICRARLTRLCHRGDDENNFEELRMRFSGTFADCWGAQLACANGEFEADDVEVKLVLPVPGRVLHVRGVCRCGSGRALLPGATGEQLELREDGRLSYRGDCLDELSPSKSVGSVQAKIPAISHSPVLECCRHPPVSLLQNSETKLTDDVISQLKEELSSSRCYAERCRDATPSSLFQFCTQFLKQRLLRCLSTVQGQVFVLLKYIIGRLLTRLVDGLPDNLAKLLLFQMLHSTPSGEWRPENVLKLTRQSLRTLQNRLLASSDGTAALIPDIFCPTVHVRLEPNHSDRQQIFDAIEAVRQDLTNQLEQYCSEPLRPACQVFYYQPFLVMPDLQLCQEFDAQSPDSTNLVQEYHQLYDLVRQLLVNLATPGNSCSLAQHLKLINDLPACARTTAASLRVLTHLREGDRAAAVQAIRSHTFRSHSGIKYPQWRSDDLASNQARANRLVEQYLVTSDCAWKFCFKFSQHQQIRLEFLPPSLQANFPLELDRSSGVFFMNFDCLLKCLQFELISGAGGMSAGSLSC